MGSKTSEEQRRAEKAQAQKNENKQSALSLGSFTFYDGAFTVDQSRAEEICREIYNRNVKITWDCGIRVDMVTKDMLLNLYP